MTKVLIHRHFKLGKNILKDFKIELNISTSQVLEILSCKSILLHSGRCALFVSLKILQSDTEYITPKLSDNGLRKVQ